MVALRVEAGAGRAARVAAPRRLGAPTLGGGGRVPRGPGSRRVGSSRAVLARAEAGEAVIEVVEPAVSTPEPSRPPAVLPSWAPLAGSLAVGLAAGWALGSSAVRARGRSHLIPPSLRGNYSITETRSPVELTQAAALASARQGKAVARAAELRRHGDPARACVELERAIADNSICRHPILRATVSKDDARALYRMHLLRTLDPNDYGRLLQLREMLLLTGDDAAEIEASVRGESEGYSI